MPSQLQKNGHLGKMVWGGGGDKTKTKPYESETSYHLGGFPTVIGVEAS